MTAKLYKAEALAVIGAADLIITEEIDSLFDSGELIVEQLHGPEWRLELKDENDTALRVLKEKLTSLERMTRRLQEDDE